MKSLIKITVVLAVILAASPVATAQIEGYKVVCKENQNQYFSIPTDIAYGNGGKYVYKYGVTGQVEYNNRTLGDPAPGILKKGYAKSYLFACNEGSSKSFNIPVVAAYGANGKYIYKRGVVGTVKFNNQSFGSDPAPNVQKKGYYKPFQEVEKEGKSYYINGRADVAYGANGRFIIKKNVSGWIKFDNVTFGSDPAPNTPKKGYINRR